MNNRPVVTVDYELYARYLEGSDLTEEQKRELLQTLWSIIVEFAQLGFGVHPLQQAQDACGKNAEIMKDSALLASNGLYLDHSFLKENFAKASGLKTALEEKGVDS